MVEFTMRCWKLALSIAVLATAATPIAAAPLTTGFGSCTGLPSARATLTSESNTELARRIFMIHLYGSSGDVVTTEQGAANFALFGVAEPQEVIKKWNPAGVILIDRNPQDKARPNLKTANVINRTQLRALTESLSKSSKSSRLLIAIDQEGGRVNRLLPIVGRRPSAAEVGVDRRRTISAAQQTADDLSGLGINMNLAPVADVVRNGAKRNSIIGDRSYNSNPALAADRVGAVVQTLQRAHVAAVAKHWPGHGSTLVDSHRKTPTINLTDRELETGDLVPFNEAIRNNVAAVMVGHLAVPAWDHSGKPATISKPIVDHLRSAFCGVIVSDSLWMGGIRNQGSDPAIALQALMAGIDLLLMPVDLAASISIIATAAGKSPSVRSRLLDAAARIEVLGTVVPTTTTHVSMLRESVESHYRFRQNLW
jgi:beta-N-acetylhexosaminidase